MRPPSPFPEVVHQPAWPAGGSRVLGRQERASSHTLGEEGEAANTSLAGKQVRAGPAIPSVSAMPPAVLRTPPTPVHCRKPGPQPHRRGHHWAGTGRPGPVGLSSPEASSGRSSRSQRDGPTDTASPKAETGYGPTQPPCWGGGWPCTGGRGPVGPGRRADSLMGTRPGPQPWSSQALEEAPCTFVRGREQHWSRVCR